MPRGKGTYGSKVGRPPAKRKATKKSPVKFNAKLKKASAKGKLTGKFKKAVDASPITFGFGAAAMAKAVGKRIATAKAKPRVKAKPRAKAKATSIKVATKAKSRVKAKAKPTKENRYKKAFAKSGIKPGTKTAMGPKREKAKTTGRQASIATGAGKKVRRPSGSTVRPGRRGKSNVPTVGKPRRGTASGIPRAIQRKRM